MDLVFSFKDINPNNEPEWTCPHCSRAFATSRTHYYNSHHGGRCLLSAGQQATAHKGIEQLLTEDGAYIDELGNEYTGEAALLAMQHDAARADLEQRCIELGVTQEQLAGLQGVLQQMAQPITHLLSNLDSTQQGQRRLWMQTQQLSSSRQRRCGTGWTRPFALARPSPPTRRWCCCLSGAASIPSRSGVC